MPELYAQIILPLSLHDSYTYVVPESMQKAIQPGQRVIVQFGQKRLYAALVLSLTKNKPQNVEIKDIKDILDENPIVLQNNLKLWEWMAKYYCCTLGDVFRAALPTGLKLDSKSKVSLTGSDTETIIGNKEHVLLRLIESGPFYLSELQKRKDFSYPALKLLQGKNLVSIEEKVSEKYKPKTETFVRFHSSIKKESDLELKMEKLGRAKKQLELFYHFCAKTKAFEPDQIKSISKKELLDSTNFNPGLVKELAKKEILAEFQETVSRIEQTAIAQVSLNLLNHYQEEALTQIKQAFETKQVALIHGITASGKTEIYIHLIDDILKTGRQALYLVPEISLTTQIIKRLQNVFGNKVGIYHSKMNSQERVEIWNKVLEFQNNPDKGYGVVLGARSALFLPFSNLGMIIVDEEHENTFKQYDPAPRYNARDMAVILGYQNKAKVLLGSATPSIESYFNAISGKYALVNLFKRHAEVEPPEMLVADIKRAFKRRQMHSLLTPELYKSIENALEQKEQVILFQNRRGYSPYVECFSCGWIPKCVNCDVSLTYHKYKKRLSCHYCGYNMLLPAACDDCGSPEIKTRGFGTEKIEDELKSLFKNARIARMDLDTTQTKNAFEKIVHNLENKRTDILIGTQMVTKGLDFEHVSVVGILNADNLINFPDFRAHERAYQLISQVSGRAGRKHKQGRVVIQTTQPDHPLIQLAKEQDFNTHIQSQLTERKLFKYPPYSRLIKIIVKHKNLPTVERASQQLADELRKSRLFIVLGPEFPLISRIQLWHHKEIWLKISRRQDLDEVKTTIQHAVETVRHLPSNSSCIINTDVDPF